jgi:hypothetical protein
MEMDNLKNESNVLYTMLGTVHLLDDEKLTVAFHILFDKDCKKYWTERDKAREMRSIFNGGTQPCRPFENWVKCIKYLSLHCA